MAFVKPFFDLCQSFPSFFSWNAWKHLFRIWTQWDILKPFSKVYKGSYYVLISFEKKSILLRIILTLLLIQYLFIFCIDSPEHLSHLIFDFAYNYWKLRWLLIYFSRVSSPDDWLNYCEIRSPLIALVECLGV